MENIRNIILEKWHNTMRDSKMEFPFSSKNLKTLYDLYDEHAFYNQLRIQEKKTNRSIIFQKEYPQNVEVNRLCGIRYYSINEREVINFRLSSWVLTRIANLTEKQLKTIGDVTYKKGIAFLLAFEHQLTHLIFLLWGHEESHVHGKLFKCVHNSFFNEEKHTDIMDVITSEKSYPQPSMNHGAYSYWNNSCYLDSLSSILYFCKSPIFRDAIFTTNADLVSYTTKTNPKKFINPCATDISETTFVDLTQNLQSAMFTDYIEMLTGEHTKCVDVRTILSLCYTDMKKDGSWKLYNAAEIYDLIANMFPRLLNVGYSVAYYDSNETKLYERIERHPKSVFTFWEFMEPLSNEGDDNYSRIIWDTIDSDVLVFRNGGIPVITNFGSMKSEIISVPDYKNGKLYMKKTAIVKGAVFSEYIIDEKYEMVGVIVLHGTIPGESSGAHYTSYVKVSDKWVEYNDIGNIWRYTKGNGSFPKNILEEKGGAKPELYFYQKIR